MAARSAQRNHNLIPEIQQLMMELVKQSVLSGQRMDALGQRLDAMGHRMEATIERQDKKFDEMRTLFLTVIDRLRSVEQTLTRLPDAVKEKIGFNPSANP